MMGEPHSCFGEHPIKTKRGDVMRLRLKAKLLIPLTIIMITGFMTSIAISYFSSRQTLEAMVSNSIMTLSDTMAAKINQWMARNKVDIEHWSRMDSVTHIFNSADSAGAIENINTQLKYYIERYHLFNGMRITNEKRNE